MAVRNYDPKKISVIIGGVPAKAFADGDFIEIEFNEDQWKRMTGADGETTRTKTADLSGKITVTLQHTSPSNESFSQLALADLLSGTGTTTFLMKDNLGRETAAAATMWLTKYPKITFGKDAGTRVWVFETDELILGYVPKT